MNILHEPIQFVKHPNTHAIIKPDATSEPIPEYTKEERRKDILRFVGQLFCYIGFLILVLAVCAGVSLLLKDTPLLGPWLAVCLLLGWLAAELGALFFD